MPTTSTRAAARHVAVTGAGSGIGRAVALRLAAEGARLSLFARDLERLRATAAAARAAGADDVHVASCDIRDRTQVETCFARAADQLGPYAALVANAGIGGANAPGTGDRFDDIVATNLAGTYSCLRAAERHLVPAPARADLVVVASVLARIGVAGYSGYCASKAGLLGLVRALAVELAPRAVQVNALCPGWVDTAMAREGLEGMAAAMGTTVEQARAAALAAVPLGRMSTPEEIAGTVSWLLGPDARGITGQGLDVNGGAWM